ncbi:Crp/Fnr family transcriptional regulator [Clostridium septicum]|uniref:Crp/Fnr family transcriptional regulator n=1 Tax=Clostridium septicum TaxID=1504 RepID=A0A9N7JM16_CLOSE|nr:Crp/Fnr family transcriptional regulator [Clostridium septicum]AYE35144.1 Crp/Fnr family transcriptional regulator [Clostridium septicum]MDU1314249.1 Crp/Fnr family transcriptional regulator [Clostridium septicum]UEC20204.1 Crp/Fnr family transcriptional regulator [Clostridium septicum]USS01741.1 Crp/Fnr family transcriptional regulator [Clostridium septicum]WLF70314.1 Crp/Fnr family transcriptional regulator [Clostridium septicum]
MNNLPYFLDTCPDYIKDKFININFNTFDKILIQNQVADSVYIIRNGKVKVYSLTPTGVKHLERTYCENDLFGELELFVEKPILNYVEALEPCEAIKVSKESFLEWIKHDSDFSLYVHIQLSEKMYHTSINSKANVAYHLKYRLLFFLWKFLNEHNLDTVHKDILVEGVGSNIRSVNRIIKELVNENLIEYNKGFVKVKDINKIVDTIFSSNNNLLSI